MSDRSPDDARALVGRLSDTYGASLYRYAALLLADATAAEDVVQQVFTSILRQGRRLDEEARYLRRAVRDEGRARERTAGHRRSSTSPGGRARSRVLITSRARCSRSDPAPGARLHQFANG